MRPDSDRLTELLADAWTRWAQRCAELDHDQWRAPTRCGNWDVAALVAHACPTPQMFQTLGEAVLDQAAEVTDAADLLRGFNAPGGVAHTSADRVADTAVDEARDLSPQSAATRFTDCAKIIAATPMPQSTVIAYPVVGSTTLAVIAEVALMEATVHLLDLAHAVGGVAPSPDALAATRDLLIAIPDPTAAVEVLAGRVPASVAVPAVR